MSAFTPACTLRRLPRRQFLAASAVGAAATSLLAACGSTAAVTASASGSVSSAATAVTASTTSITAKMAVATAASATVSAPTASSAAATAAKGAVVIWHGWGKTGGGLAMTEQAAAYRQANPGVSVEMVDSANVQTLIAAIAGGTPPDVMTLVEGQLPPLAVKQAFLPLDANFARDHIDLNAFWSISKENAAFQGKVYAMPHHQGCYVFFWNKSLFKNAGVNADQPPKTWNDLTGLAPKLTKDNGGQFTQLGFVPIWIQVSWALASFVADGVPIFSTDGHSVAFDTSAGVNALSWAPQVFAQYQNGYTGWNTWFTAAKPTLPAGPPAQTLYTRGQLAMLWWGNWLFDSIQRLSPTLEYGVSGIPTGPDSTAQPAAQSGGGASLSVPTGAKNVDGGWAFLAFVGSPEGQYLTQKDTSDVAALMSAASDPRILGSKLGRAAVLPLFKAATAGATLSSPVADTLSPAIVTLQTAVLTGKQSARDALHTAATSMNQTLSTYYAKNG
ncbi:MAG TPA: extracellular solute-binding protein [Chloroflexota bacterium]|nr:extracellular solute-binding protein [Chloroflexota bacterium]